MRLAFFGTADFSVAPLRALVETGHDVVAVVTQPARPGDRGRPAPRPVADAAGELGLRLLQPPRLRDAEAVATILALHLDALIVAAYGQILPRALLDGPRFGGVNVHASLLPRHRGASPVAAAILAGDAETGVSIMRMEEGVDTGPVYATRSTPIAPAETAVALSRRLALIGAALLVEVLDRLDAGAIEPTPQDAAMATYAPRLRREDGIIDWAELSAVDVDRRVRALAPWPGTTAWLAGAEVRLLAGRPLPHLSVTPPGSLGRVAAARIGIACRSGVYAIDRLQPPGRRPMDPPAYLRGRRIDVPTLPVSKPG